LKTLDAVIAWLNVYGLREYDVTIHEYRIVQFLSGILGVAIQHSDILVYFVILLNAMANPSIISLVYPISLFCYALLEDPKPNKIYFRFLFLYTTVILCIKFFFQVPFFCECSNSYNIWRWDQTNIPLSQRTGCGTPACSTARNTASLPRLIGIYSFDLQGTGIIFARYVAYDILVLAVLNLNQHNMKRTGMWDYSVPSTDSLAHPEIKGPKRASLESAEASEAAKLKKKKKAKKLARAVSKRKMSVTKGIQEKPRSPDTTPSIEKTSAEELNVRVDSDLEHSEKDDVEPNQKEVNFNEAILEKTMDFSESSESENATSKSAAAPVPRSPSSLSAKISDTRSRCLERCGTIWNSVQLYFFHLTKEKFHGQDWYSIIFFIDLISFFVFAFSPSEFISEKDNIVQYINSNTLPSTFVIVLFLLFCLMILERIVHLHRAIRAKMLLLYIFSIVYHVLLFISIPYRQERSFSELRTIIFFYLLKCVYFIASCLQIRDGYPPDVSKRTLTNHSQPGTLHALVFQIYRAIPFVYEIRTFLDWAITPTTLTLYQWLKFEDIYAELFLVQCRIVVERQEARPVGKVQPTWYKVVAGGGIILLLVCLLWIPLLPWMSGVSGLGNPNPVLGAVLRVGFVGYGDIYSSYSPKLASDLSYLPDSVFRNILGYYQKENSVFNEDMSNAQVGEFTQWGEHYWDLAPVSYQKLIGALGRRDNVSMFIEMKFTRPKPENQKEITWFEHQVLSNETKDAFYSVLSNLDERGPNTIMIPRVIPRFFHLLTTPPSPSPSVDSRSNITLNLKFSNITYNFTNKQGVVTTISEFGQYWNLSTTPQNSAPPPFGSNNSKVSIVIVSQPIPNIIPETFALTGIIGVYTVFVLGVGRFLRMGVSGLSHLAMYEDMPDVDRLLEHCKNILFARQDGDTELEEELFRELIEIYRSPEKLLIWTSKQTEEED